MPCTVYPTQHSPVHVVDGEQQFLPAPPSTHQPRARLAIQEDFDHRVVQDRPEDVLVTEIPALPKLPKPSASCAKRASPEVAGEHALERTAHRPGRPGRSAARRAGSGADRPVAARSATDFHPPGRLAAPTAPTTRPDRTSCPAGDRDGRCDACREGRAGSGRGSALVAFTGSSGLPGASEQADVIRHLRVVAARGVVAPLRHPAGALLGGYGSLFKGRRLWCTMAVAMIVIVVMRYALGWFSEGPTPAALSDRSLDHGRSLRFRKADMALLACLGGERTWMTNRKE
jgi:hypothetical protein